MEHPYKEVRLVPLSLRAEPGPQWSPVEMGGGTDGLWEGVSDLPALVSTLRVSQGPKRAGS